MLERPSFSDLDYQQKRRKTHREEFPAGYSGSLVSAGSIDSASLPESWEWTGVPTPCR